jgi:hypothetical protein
MSRTYAPVNVFNLLKACIIFFVVQALITIVFFQPIWYSELAYRFLLLLINIAISVFFGWRLYKQRYHLVFSYDDVGFTLKQGSKEEMHRTWGEFSKVSLVRTEQGDFSIKLENGDSFDLPVSKIKLDPYDFRTEATKLVETSQKRKSG